MEQTANVTEENVRVTDGTEAECTDANTAKADSGLPEKFKSVHALAEAYNALQAEFTRRCQRLRELEARADNLSRGEKADEENGSSKNGSGGKAAAGCEEKTAPVNPPDNAQSPAHALKNDSKDSEQENGETRSESVRESESAGEKTDGNAGGNEATDVSGVDAEAKEESVSEQTRLKIIADYLSSLKKNAAPLVRGGAGTLSTPPARPASIEEAGRMALRHFRA